MRVIWETRRGGETEEDRLIERFTRRETETEWRARIARRPVDPGQVAALRRLWAVYVAGWGETT